MDEEFVGYLLDEPEYKNKCKDKVRVKMPDGEVIYVRNLYQIRAAILRLPDHPRNYHSIIFLRRIMNNDEPLTLYGDNNETITIYIEYVGNEWNTNNDTK